jgi:hypothetical protein
MPAASTATLDTSLARLRGSISSERKSTCTTAGLMMRCGFFFHCGPRPVSGRSRHDKFEDVEIIFEDWQRIAHYQCA